MNAVKLRLILIAVILLGICGIAAGVWFLRETVAAAVQEADHTRIEADVSAAELSQLRRLEQQLKDTQEIVERAQQIAAPANQYRYQDQIINDLSKYASRHNLQVNTFDFSNSTTGASRPGQQAAPTVAGAKKTPFTITLKGPVPYSNFLAFIRDVELNLTKIQVTSLALSPDKNPSLVANPSLSLEVYIRN